MSNGIPSSAIIPLVASLQSVLAALSVSPPGASITATSSSPCTATLTDGAGAVWGLGSGTNPTRITRNGIAVGGGDPGDTLRIDINGVMWTLNSAGQWYMWSTINGPWVTESSGPNIGTAPLPPALVLANSLQAIVTAIQAALVQPAPPPGMQGDIIALFKLAVPLGFNLSGAEFGTVPGTLNTNYFMDTTTLPFMAALGTPPGSAAPKKVRVPFRGERMVPGFPSNLTLDPAHVAWLTNMITTYPGVTFVLDMHNFGQWVQAGVAGGIGNTGGPTVAQFAAAWLAIATQFGPYSNVEFGLMNEPDVQTVAQIAAMDNAAIAAIRGGGFTNRCWVDGASSSAGSNWTTSSGNMALFTSITDANTGFDIHQYGDASGEDIAPVTVANGVVNNLIAVTAAARSAGKILMLGEFGTDSGTVGLQCIALTMNFILQNGDVWQGGSTWWNACQEDGPYISALTTGGTSPAANPQLTALLNYW
jgi:endoglucanase